MSKRFTPAKSAAAKRAAFANQRHQMALSRKKGHGLPVAELRVLRMEAGLHCQPLGPERKGCYLAGLYWTDHYSYMVPNNWYQLYYLLKGR